MHTFKPEITMHTITINETQFQIKDAAEAGIVAGAVLDEAAAKQLYQVRRENIGNLLRSKIKEMATAGASFEAMQAAVTERDNTYSFSVRGEGVGRKPVDPLERECIALAKDWVKDQLAAEGKGRKMKDLDPEKLAAKIDQVSAHPDIVKLAKKRLAEKRRAGADDLSLDL